MDFSMTTGRASSVGISPRQEDSPLEAEGPGEAAGPRFLSHVQEDSAGWRLGHSEAPRPRGPPPVVPSPPGLHHAVPLYPGVGPSTPRCPSSRPPGVGTSPDTSTPTDNSPWRQFRLSRDSTPCYSSGRALSWVQGQPSPVPSSSAGGPTASPSTMEELMFTSQLDMGEVPREAPMDWSPSQSHVSSSSTGGASTPTTLEEEGIKPPGTAPYSLPYPHLLNTSNQRPILSMEDPFAPTQPTVPRRSSGTRWATLEEPSSTPYYPPYPYLMDRRTTLEEAVSRRPALTVEEQLTPPWYHPGGYTPAPCAVSSSTQQLQPPDNYTTEDLSPARSYNTPPPRRPGHPYPETSCTQHSSQQHSTPPPVDLSFSPYHPGGASVLDTTDGSPEALSPQFAPIWTPPSSSDTTGGSPSQEDVHNSPESPPANSSSPEQHLESPPGRRPTLRRGRKRGSFKWFLTPHQERALLVAFNANPYVGWRRHYDLGINLGIYPEVVKEFFQYMRRLVLRGLSTEQVSTTKKAFKAQFKRLPQHPRALDIALGTSIPIPVFPPGTSPSATDPGAAQSTTQVTGLSVIDHPMATSTPWQTLETTATLSPDQQWVFAAGTLSTVPSSSNYSTGVSGTQEESALTAPVPSSSTHSCATGVSGTGQDSVLAALADITNSLPYIVTRDYTEDVDVLN